MAEFLWVHLEDVGIIHVPCWLVFAQILLYIALGSPLPSQALICVNEG